jgi:uncharacterized protein (DUF1778 family)
VVDSATMAADDTPLDPQVVNLAIEETESFLDLLPPELSLRVLPASLRTSPTRRTRSRLQR